jgi:kumamolisin
MKLRALMLAAALTLGAGGVSIAVASNDSSIPGALPGVSRILPDTVPGLVADSKALGALQPTQKLAVALPLVLPRQAALNRYLAAEYDPHSVDYRRFLKPAQFAVRFGAPAAQVSKVESVLRGLGLGVATPTANHLYVSATGSAALLERVFDTRLERFHVNLKGTARAFESSDYFANTTDIRLPAALNGLATGVVGLNDANAPHPMLAYPSARSVLLARKLRPHFGTPVGQYGGATPCAAAIVGGGYTAPDLATAYDFNGIYEKGFLGQGMSMALAEYDDYHDSNVAGVESCYGLQTPVTRVLIDGGSGGPPSYGEGEDMADISTILGLVPKLAHLYVYVGPSTSGVADDGDTGEIDLYNKFVMQDVATVLSSSWGSCEQIDSEAFSQLYNEVAEEAAVQGQQIFSAAGDSGAVDCSGYPTPVSASIAVEQEASSPWVTGVGGTDLSVDSTVLGGGVHREDVWNDGGSGGGGQSVIEPMPAWQANYLRAAQDTPAGAIKGSPSSPAPCGVSAAYCRMVPDIAMNADPSLGGIGDPGPKPPQFAAEGDVGSPGDAMYCATSNCSDPTAVDGWYPIGGTSLATPTAASAAILWDQEAKAAGLGNGFGFLNPLLYQVASNPSAYQADFHDITVGNNDDQYGGTDCPKGCNAKHLYNSGRGYDMASGLGSPIVATLGVSLTSAAAEINLTPDSESLYGYTKGVPTTGAVSVTSGFSGSGFSADSSARWLHVEANSRIPAALHWHASPAGLKPGHYRGTITLHGRDGKTSKLTVSYWVTPPARITVSPSSLHFAEQAVNSHNKPTTATCGTSTWDDEFEYNGSIGTSGPTNKPKPQKSSLATLRIKNAGPRSSVLHYQVLLFAPTGGGWLSTNFDPNDDPSGLLTTPGQPLVKTSGALSGGATRELKLASIANVNVLGGYPAMNQGTYYGTVYIEDLANPDKLIKVPATLRLGSGKGTPTIATAPRAISVTLPVGASRTVNVVLSDSSHRCGYVYSLSSDEPWATISPDLFSGTVLATPAKTAPASSDTGGGNGFTPVTINSTGLPSGVYHDEITINSQNANTNPTEVPITLTVTT